MPAWQSFLIAHAAIPDSLPQKVKHLRQLLLKQQRRSLHIELDLANLLMAFLKSRWQHDSQLASIRMQFRMLLIAYYADRPASVTPVTGYCCVSS